MEQEETLKKVSENSNVSIIDINYVPFNICMGVLFWRNSPEIRKWMFRQNIISEEEHFRWLFRIVKGRESEKHFIIFYSDDSSPTGIPCGVVGFKGLDDPRKTCYEHIYVYKVTGVAARAEYLAHEWLFSRTDIQKSQVEYFEGNPVKFVHLKTGYEEEGILKNAAIFEGKRVDLHIMGLTKEKWEKK